jgi:HK97 family phage portal protein
VVEEPRLRWRGADSNLLLVGPVSAPSRLTGDFWGEQGALAHGRGDGDVAPAITRATSLIADTLAGVPWRVRRGREVLPDPRWLVDPDLSRPDLRIAQAAGSTAVQPLDTMSWRSTLIVSALWWGDGFVWVERRDATGQPVPPLHLLHPGLVEVVTEAEAAASGRDAGYWIDGSGPWTSANVIHVRGMSPIVGGRGRGVLAGHLAAWREAEAQRDYASSLFTAGIPAGYLKTSTPNMTEAQAEALKARWLAQHSGARRTIAVLNAATEFHPIQLPPEAAQMVEARRLSILDVANAFGVEPYMLGLAADGATYANIQDRMNAFARFSLLQWARRVEEAFSRELPTGTSVWIDLDSLARANNNDRTQYYKNGLADGWLTVDEVRASEGLPPMTGGVVL